MWNESCAEAGWLDRFPRWNRRSRSDKRQSSTERIARTAPQIVALSALVGRSPASSGHFAPDKFKLTYYAAAVRIGSYYLPLESNSTAAVCVVPLKSVGSEARTRGIAKSPSTIALWSLPANALLGIHAHLVADFDIMHSGHSPDDEFVNAVLALALKADG
jgi:hypothetical protein